MALNEGDFRVEMQKFMDKEYEDFVGFPKTLEESKEKMANAVFVLCENITPISTTVSQAKDDMISNLGDMSPIAMSLGFSSFAITLGVGMVGYVATPPSSSIDLSPVSTIGLSGGSALDCLTTPTIGIVDIIVNWFKTGTATDVSGNTINWS